MDASTRSADSRVRPDPENARNARGRLPRDGCFLSRGETRSPRCVYGDRSSHKRVVLFGDSHAMHYYPALGRLVRERGWRLVVLTKGGCPPMLAVKRGTRGERTECAVWRRRALKRIASRKPPQMVITGGSVNYAVYNRNGERLEEAAADAALERSHETVLERLGRTGARLVVMKDVPKADYDIPGCVADNLDRPRKCAFPLPAGHWRDFDTRAARASGARLIKMTRAICRDRLCRAVIRDVLIYRAGSHLTAPFARTLRPRLGRRLPRLR